MTEGSEIINKLLDYLDINASQFALSIGLDRPQAIYDIQKKKTSSITSRMALKICSVYPEISKTWLLTGEGPMLNSEKSEVTHVIPDDTIVAPLISQYAYGGYMRGFADPIYIKDQPIYTARVKHNGGNYVAFEVKGDSMDDRSYRSICEGDLVLGRELQKEYWTSRLHIPKVFIIVHKEEGVVIKEIIEHDVETGRILCHSWNPLPEYEDFEINLKDVFQLFYIKEITRNVKY